jgi:hypothetical protein
MSAAFFGRKFAMLGIVKKKKSSVLREKIIILEKPWL